MHAIPYFRMRFTTALCTAALSVMAACSGERAFDAISGSGITAPSSGVILNAASGATVNAGIGDTILLGANQSTRRGRVLRWSSSNAGIVVVNQSGVAVANGLGTATVYASGADAVERWMIEVGRAVATVSVSPDSVSSTPGMTVQLLATARASDGTAVVGRPVLFTVANAAIATVSSSGLVTARTVGVTTILVGAGAASRVVRVSVASVPTTPIPPTTPIQPVAPTTPTTPTTPGSPLGLNAALTSRTIFPENNAWNQPVDTASVDPNSVAIIAGIGATKSFHPDFGANYNGAPFGIPYFVVSNAQAGVNVTFDYDDESDHGLYPLPVGAPIEGGASSGGDRHVIVVNRDTWKLYELYYAFPKSNGSWQAGSGAIFDLTSNALRPAGWTSADAAGLPILPGLVRYDEVSAGVIAHAIRFTVSRSRKAYVVPARHWASSDTSSIRPPMGMRVRLKSTVNISGYPASAQVILKALKKYGMIVADNGSDWFVSGTADARWNDSEINSLKALRGSDFEVVRMSGVVKP